jgi:uncharacterized membrane protein HdeD (DUF308 family)
MTETTPQESLAALAKGLWWLVLIRGILAIVFGVIALISPAIALTAIAIVYGAYALVDGIAGIVHGVQVRTTNARWGWLIAGGVVSVLAGLVALVVPGLVGAFGGLVVLWTLVIWSVVSGVMGLRSASGAEGGRGRTWGIVAGILSLAVGVILAIAIILSPGVTLISLIWTIGVYAIIFGVTLVITAIFVRANTPAVAAAGK